MVAEPTVYHTMNGPNEFHVLGTLRSWTHHRPAAPDHRADALVIAGEFDEATPATWQPYVELIPGVRSHVFPDTSHCTHLEKPEEFRAVVARIPAPARRPSRPGLTHHLHPDRTSMAIAIRATPAVRPAHSPNHSATNRNSTASVSTVDLLVYGLVFMVPIAPWTIFGIVYNSAGGVVPLVYLIGLIAMVFTATGIRADGQVVPAGGLGVLLCRAAESTPAAGFFAGWAILLDYLLIPTLLYVLAAGIDDRACSRARRDGYGRSCSSPSTP